MELFRLPTLVTQALTAECDDLPLPTEALTVTVQAPHPPSSHPIFSQQDLRVTYHSVAI
jgi:hypothetical protein